MKRNILLVMGLVAVLAVASTASAQSLGVSATVLPSISMTFEDTAATPAAITSVTFGNVYANGTYPGTQTVTTGATRTSSTSTNFIVAVPFKAVIASANAANYDLTGTATNVPAGVTMGFGTASSLGTTVGTGTALVTAKAISSVGTTQKDSYWMGLTIPTTTAASSLTFSSTSLDITVAAH